MDVETVAAALEREHHEIDAGIEEFGVGLADGGRGCAGIGAVCARR